MSADTDPTEQAPAVPPALTPEEWAGRMLSPAHLGDTDADRDAQVISIGRDGERWPSGLVTIRNEYPIARPHALAAVCLHSQPFGFTQEEARVVAKYADHVGCNCGDFQCHEDGDEALLRSAAAKIRALLPPPQP